MVVVRKSGVLVSVLLNSISTDPDHFGNGGVISKIFHLTLGSREIAKLRNVPENAAWKSALANAG